jgi:Bacterial phosphonate metabolism protein (PhnH)
MIEMLDRPYPTQSPAGFADPVQDGQQAFRAIMDAMARPGSVHGIGANLKAPDGLNAAAASAILALCDYETVLWLAPSLRIQPEIGAYCTFHTGAPRTADPRQAAFAVLDLDMDDLDLGAFARHRRISGPVDDSGGDGSGAGWRADARTCGTRNQGQCNACRARPAG